jgi:hypothetical protein
VTDQDRPAPVFELVFGKCERLLDAQAAAPQDDDHRWHAPAVPIVGGVTHDGDDLVHRGRVGR